MHGGKGHIVTPYFFSTDLPPPFDLAWVRFAIGFMLGASLGSFGTVLAHRLPRGESIVHPRSHCPSCNATLGVRDLVPIFSYLAFRGRCRRCGIKIGIQYLLIELACAVSLGAVLAVSV
jgi:leader peptidase (prepilin peptidase)/N-methyltransferase